MLWYYISRMAKDKFNIPLDCPSCGKTGTATAEEEDGWAYIKGNKRTSITHLPDGFRIVHRKSRMASVDLYCVDCNVSAVK